MKYKNYYNFELGNRDIYSCNDILGMTVQDLFDNELPLSYQYNTIGIPKDDELINSPNTHQYTNANGKLRWRSSSKTTEDLLEEERQRRAALEAQNQAAQSQLSSIPTQSAPLANTVTEDIAPSPITNTQPLLNDNAISAIGNFAGKMINKIKNRKQTTPAEDSETPIGVPQPKPEQPVETQTPTEPEDTQNIFQRLGGKIKDAIGSLNDPKELREYKQMSRDIDRANKERQAWTQAHPEEAYGDLESLSTTANPNPWDTGYGKVVLGGPDYSMINTGGIVSQNKKPLESFAPISEHIELGYPKSINMPGINPSESILKKNPYYPFEMDDRGMIVLKGGITKDVNKESLMQKLKRKVKDFQETGFNKEDDLNLKEELQDKYQNFKQEHSNKMSPRDKIEQFIYERALNKKYPMASNATIDGMHDFKSARKQKNVQVYSDMNSINNDKYKTYLKSIGANDKTPGVVYGTHSDVSFKMSNSPELEAHLTSMREKILRGEPLDDFELVFNASKSDVGVGNASKDDKVDRMATFRKIKCCNPRVDENGVFSCEALDYSDFEDEEILSLPDIPNAWGCRMVQKGLYKPYYQIVKIRKKVNW